MAFDKDDMNRRMEGALGALKADYQGLRTGRANINLLEPVMVEAYGSPVPINQVGAISAPESRMLTVSVWDRGLVVTVEKAIRNAGLGLNPITDGQTLRIPIPPLNEERRRDLAKLAGKYAEDAKVAVRNVRRDCLDQLKKSEKDKLISEDDLKKLSEEVQKITDSYVAKVDLALKAKQEEIMQV
ncbi:MAG: ribosome recycling factor [Hyphomonadaceae bacterium]|jgi:ribosome recycling factor|nr:ribosome recycling factor [Hyphomonadaceae bacterium]